MDAIARQGHFFEDLEIGHESSYSRRVSEADIIGFATVSGDTNPVHLDEAYAQATLFKGRIAHGMLTASLFSTVFGTQLPGPGCIYVSQTLNFRAPVRIGDLVTATVRIEQLIEAKRRALFACTAMVGETTVLEGDAMLMIPRRPQS